MLISRFVVTKHTLKESSFFLSFIGGTMIWAMLLPIVLFHLAMWTYHEIYFSICGIPKIPLSEYIILDRYKLRKLRFGQKLACCYCEYANGLAAWVQRVANQTEVYSCAIKHSVKKAGQEHQKDFFEYDQFR